MKKSKEVEWNEGAPSLKVGTKITAIIRHCNKKLKLEDQEVNLKQAEDGFYVDDGPDELSYNWDIIKWRKRGKV